jgi:hypothetical protein
MPSSSPTTTRVRILLMSGEAFVTSRHQAGEFHVTPLVASAATPEEVEHVDRTWNRFDQWVVTHGPSGMRVPMLRWNADTQRHEISEASMSFGMARLFADVLSKAKGAVAPTDFGAFGWSVISPVVRECTEKAKRLYVRKHLSSKKAG